MSAGGLLNATLLHQERYFRLTMTLEANLSKSKKEFLMTSVMTRHFFIISRSESLAGTPCDMLPTHSAAHLDKRAYNNKVSNH
jgi:hypothetical protein